MVLTEGYDEPSVSGIILARPTKSALLYTQMIGRGTRLHPGKQNVTIIDIVDVTRDHSLSTLPSLFGFSEKFDLEGHTTDEVHQAIRWVETHRPWISIDQALSLSDLRYRCRRIDLLDLETPVELLPHSRFAWKETVIGSGEDIRSAIKMSEAHVTHHLTESVGLVARNTRWRRAPASDKQLRVLHSRKIKVPKGLTKGQASHLISMLP